MISPSLSGRRLAACCLALLVVSGIASAELDSATESDLNRLRNYLSATDDLRADFAQEVIGAEQEVIERASGTVVLSKPGRFRWDYSEPYERVIVADGERIWFYEADLEQVTVRRIETGLGDTPAALLTGDAQALEQFELVGSWATDGLQWIQLAPVSAEADFSVVDLGFDGDEIQQIVFVDRLSQRTRLTLSGIDRSSHLDDRVFQFEIPPGVDVIGEDDM